MPGVIPFMSDEISWDWGGLCEGGGCGLLTRPRAVPSALREKMPTEAKHEMRMSGPVNETLQYPIETGTEPLEPQSLHLDMGGSGPGQHSLKLSEHTVAFSKVC